MSLICWDPASLDTRGSLGPTVSDRRQLPGTCLCFALHMQAAAVFLHHVHFCMAIPFWFLSLAGCREMGVHPTVTDGRASSFATCPARPVSLCASIGVGVWPYRTWCFGALPHSSGFQLYSICYGRLTPLSGTHSWDLADARAPGARISFAQTHACLSRQVSMGVAASFGLPSIGANSSTCSQSQLFTCFGSRGILLYRLMGALSRLAPPFCLRSLSARGLLIQMRRCDDELAGGLLRAHSGGIQAWSRRPWTQPTGDSHLVRSIGLGVASLFRLLLSDAVVIGASCSAPASCHPCIAGLCSALFNLAIHMCLQPSTGRNYGCRPSHYTHWCPGTHMSPSGQ